MYKKIIIVALILLSCTVPAIAYDQQWYGYIPGTSTSAVEVGQLVFVNATTSHSASKITVSKPLYIENGHGAHPTGSLTGLKLYTGFGSGSGTPVGNGSMSWSCGSNYLNYDNMCDFTYIIDDLSSTLTGSETIRFGETISSVGQTNLYICSNYYGCAGKVNNSYSPSSFWTVYLPGGSVAQNGTYTVYSGAALPSLPPSPSYSCNVGVPPFVAPNYGLICTDNSTVYPVATSTEWTLTQPDSSEFITTNISLVKTLTQTGWYGLDYKICNTLGCGYANTTQLVNVTTDFIPATGIKFWVHTYDPLKSAKISGSSIMIQNLTSGGWRNVSTNAGSAYFDATNYARTELLTQGQTVKVCGSAPGYADTCANVTIAYNDWEYILNLVSTSDTPIGTNTTLIVNVIDTYTAETLSGATITVSNTSIPYSSSKLSDAGGIQTFPNIPAGTYQIVASKPGYQTSATSWPTIAGTVANAYIGLTLVGATPVITGTSGQNLYDENGNPIIGYDLDGNPITAGPTPDPRSSDQKDEDMMNTLRDQGPFLIQFFIVCFVIYMISGIGRK